ncbi:hypothetical protein LF845_09560 [Deferribacterales bacterium Es71-Z0220]|uniref:proton-conducting transporter transmembrane domain-containing protein n=1 Tax=Deferrivibrio essentukiensis TaxID=2880922 RepID=UPI001F61844E|nr:proton-conducting transporter membrane subunit [Deferrivibrio essentukiensis]MCB4205202.1 hypothetical protein [Deferrivibrio essentukiensis]
MYLLVFIGVIVVLTVLSLLIRDDRKRPIIILICGLFNFAYSIYIFHYVQSSIFPDYIKFDSIGKIIYLSYSILFFSLSVYASNYLKIRSDRGNRIFIVSMMANLLSAQFACMAQDFGVLWASMEAATLSVTPLIYFNKTKFSIEATWKFILLTSTGIAVALLGTYMLGFTALQTDGQGTINFLRLQSIVPKMDVKWLFFSTLFMVIGYASKIGLAPFHWWKPDSYGEAPGLIGGLLSGGLVSLAALCLLRIYQILSGSEVLIYISHILLILGVLSLAIAAIFAVKQKDLKRLLAYSSVEHVGIIAVGLGIGKMAIFGSLLHIMFNTFAKGVLFLNAADIQRIYGNKKIQNISGLISISPTIGWVFILGLFAAAGSPPFSLFISEFYIFLYGFKYGYSVTTLVVIILLGLIFIGLIKAGISIAYGTPSTDSIQLKEFKPTKIMLLSEILLLAILLIPLFYFPQNILSTIKDSLLILGVTNG